MTIKCILAVALITPFLTVSSMAQQYVGGPKSGVAPTRQISSGADIYAQGVGSDIYAQRVRGDVYVRGVNTNKSHAYRGGPKTVVPHGNREDVRFGSIVSKRSASNCLGCREELGAREFVAPIRSIIRRMLYASSR